MIDAIRLTSLMRLSRRNSSVSFLFYYSYYILNADQRGLLMKSNIDTENVKNKILRFRVSIKIINYVFVSLCLFVSLELYI